MTFDLLKHVGLHTHL